IKASAKWPEIGARIYRSALRMGLCLVAPPSGLPSGARLGISPARGEIIRGGDTANLPPCGGDGRQARGGRAGAITFQPSKNLTAPSRPAIPPPTPCGSQQLPREKSPASSPAPPASRTQGRAAS